MQSAAVVFLLLLIFGCAQQQKQITIEPEMDCTTEYSLFNTYLVTSAEETHYYPLLKFFYG
jgi:hypothetical protein